MPDPTIYCLVGLNGINKSINAVYLKRIKKNEKTCLLPAH